MPGNIKTSISYMTLGMILFTFGFMVLGSNIVDCVEKSVCHTGEEKKMLARKIEEVLKEHTDDLMAIPGVVGTGQGLCDGKPCIKVFVIKKTIELQEKISGKLEGYPVKIEETGEIRALPENQH